MKKNLVKELSFQFSLDLITYCESLLSMNKYVFANQLLKSGTSIGANVSEAQFAQSRRDFISKLSISAKEANETRYWLRLCLASDHYPDPPPPLIAQCEELQSLLSRIIISSKRNG